MQHIFLILGYGIPKEVQKDFNYRCYLSLVLNAIYTTVTTQQVMQPMIICSGGKTDVFPPYKRNEGDEMLRFFKEIIKQKPSLKKITRDWKFIPEKTSLSTLENLLNTKKIIEKRNIQPYSLTIFCEATRTKRITVLAKKIFSFPVRVVPIDFDVSANRYLDPEFLHKKERTVQRKDLWALESEENFKKYHQVFEEKLAFLRKAGPKKHEQAIQQWWEKKLNELN